MNKKIDFTDCKKIYKAYNGANGKKIAVEYQDTVYMIKFPPSGANKPTELSYTNSCISEYISCHVFNMVGITAQDTLLGTYRIGEKEKVVCACRDFSIGEKVLYDFCSIKNTVLDSETNGSGTELEDIIDTIEKQGYIEPNKLKTHFWNVFVVDALLGNFDRHNGNWGFLQDMKTQEIEIAPVYDCGSCLLPQADEKMMKNIMESRELLQARIFQFPTSAIKRNGKKIGYYDFLMSDHMPYECRRALRQIVPKINIPKIVEMISDIQYITKTQKEFYGYYLSERYNQILMPAFQRLVSLEKMKRKHQNKQTMEYQEEEELER